MSEEINKSKRKMLFEGLIGKLKRIKHLDIILTVLFIAIILLIYFSTFSSSSNSVKGNKIQDQTGQTQSSTSLLADNTLLNYATKIEDRLEQIISQIKDAGLVKVAVSFEGEIQTIIAYTTKIEELENGTKVETKSPVLITNKDGQTAPIVLETKMPNIKSIVVVASGAKNTNVKLEILRAVQAVLGLPSSNIEIFAGI